MMIPAGSRLLIGATVLTALAAAAYGTTNGGTLGTTGLIFAAIGLAVLTGINVYTRDADVSAMDEKARTESAAARPAPWPCLWPLIGALAAVLLVVGLVSYPIVFILGIICLVAAFVEWTLQAWSERASADATYNSQIRERFAHAAEFPVLAALLAGVIVYSFSRIMLALSKTGGPAAFAAIAALVLAGGFIVAFRRNLDPGVIAGVAAVAVLALVAGGAVAAISGERELHPHLTVDEVAAAGECGDEETEADQNASGSVAAKANVFAEIVLGEDNALIAQQPDLPDSTSVTLQRANPTNIRFRNETDEPRRLVLQYQRREDSEAVPVEECTALVEKGGSQWMTFTIDLPSTDYGPFQLVVPGVDDQSIDVVVP